MWKSSIWLFRSFIVWFSNGKPFFFQLKPFKPILDVAKILNLSLSHKGLDFEGRDHYLVTKASYYVQEWILSNDLHEKTWKIWAIKLRKSKWGCEAASDLLGLGGSRRFDFGGRQSIVRGLQVEALLHSSQHLGIFRHFFS